MSSEWVMLNSSLPEKKTITVNGVTTEYSLSGASGPVVILLNGFRMPLGSWDSLYPAIQQHGRIFAYNRHGVGKTSKATCPQTGEEVIRSLENVLRALNLSPPYILVAHSLGGLFANLYARLKPDDVAAVVFVDAAHPDEKGRQENFKPPRFLRFITGVLKAIDTRFDKYQHSEDDCVAETVRQIEAAGYFPPIPVAVVTGGKKMPLVPEACFAIHRQCQNELTALSPHSVHIIANNSGHFPQITEPDLVIQAIKEIVNKVKHGMS
jgi:pimeloyl-ACP methyl ester carboxylesterase